MNPKGLLETAELSELVSPKHKEVRMTDKSVDKKMVR